MNTSQGARKHIQRARRQDVLDAGLLRYAFRALNRYNPLCGGIIVGGGGGGVTTTGGGTKQPFVPGTQFEAAAFTMSVKLCVANGTTLLLALKTIV